LFRQSAFPETTDNSGEFFRRCYPQSDAATRQFRGAVAALRERIDDWLDEMIATHELDRAGLVGFTSMFNQNLASFALARKIKQRGGNVTTVIGGANCEYPMGGEIASRAACIDFVFSGPALKSFPQFVQNLVRGGRDDCQRIDGVLSRHNHAAEPV